MHPNDRPRQFTAADKQLPPVVYGWHLRPLAVEVASDHTIGKRAGKVQVLPARRGRGHVHVESGLLLEVSYQITGLIHVPAGTVSEDENERGDNRCDKYDCDKGE